MRYVRIGVIVLFIGVLSAAVVLHFTRIEDSTIPVISCSEIEIEAKCSVTDEELLSYVTAYDAKDGELTDKIIIESISKFVEIGIADVTYAVCDMDNNVAKLTRRVTFTDYHAPRIRLADSFSFTIGDGSTDLLSHIAATDMFDGNIHRKLTIVASDFDGSAEGIYPVTFKASNSMGDYSIITFDAYVHAEEYPADIQLREHTVYIKAGDSFDPHSLISEVIDANTGRESRTYTVEDVSVNASQLDATKPGIYNIIYTIADPDTGTAAWARANVVCEE